MPVLDKKVKVTGR